jgi:hypothetical protein
MGVKQYFRSILNGLIVIQGIKIESHSEAFPEIYKKYFHVVHVAINQLTIFGLDMHLH